MKDGQWWDKSWNPIQGCSPCSIGCKFCWAKAMADRFNGGDFSIKLHPERLDQPLHWREPKRIFVCSMSDLFHPKVPFEFIEKIWDVMLDCMNIHNNPVWLYRQSHTFQILTKRIGRALEFSKWMLKKHRRIDYSNVHLGVSISNQAEADEKIPILLQIPAAVRWLSIEPMLEGIDLSRYVFEECRKIKCINCGSYKSTGVWGIYMCGECGCGEGEEVDPNCEIDGVVVGGESGPKRRWCNIRWVDSIVDQCEAANVPCFVKQIHKDGKVVKMPEQYPQELPERKA